MSEASGHQGLWMEPKYPGDAVRIMCLKRGEELGSIRIQHYGPTVRVASFLPGHETNVPGDTPKVEPERHEWHRHSDPADAAFDGYVQAAFADGWGRDYEADTAWERTP